jgi:hypothetical protein
MKDIFIFLAAFALGYMAFVSITLFLGKLIFPFLTKEELKKRNAVISLRR